MLLKIAYGTSVALATSLFAPVHALSAQDTNRVVVHTVTGRGPTVYEARLDAIRTALQQSVAQLVFADRAVDGDAVLRDQVVSTMNGFVERFETLSVSNCDNAYIVEARVSVSESRIQNFATLGSGGSDALQVDGQSIGAAIAAQREQAKRLGDVLGRTLDGFPEIAIDVRVLEIVPVLSDEEVRIRFEYGVNPVYIESWRGILTSLGARPALRAQAGVPHVRIDDRIFIFPTSRVELGKPYGNSWMAATDFYGSSLVLPLKVVAGSQTANVDVWMESYHGDFRVYSLSQSTFLLSLSSRKVRGEITLPASLFEDATEVRLLVRPNAEPLRCSYPPTDGRSAGRGGPRYCLEMR